MSEEQFQDRINALEREHEQTRNAMWQLLEKKQNEIYALYHVSRTIGSVLDIQEMLLQVAGIIKKSIPFERLSLYLLDAATATLELAFFTGLNIDRKITIPVGEGIPGRIAEHGEHVHIHDLSLFYETFNDFAHYPEEPPQDGSYIGIALKARNEVIGVIGMDSPAKYGLNVDDMDFMAILSHQIAVGIEKSRYFEMIQQLSQRDGLTGLYNHRMFQEKLRHELSRRDRTQKSLSLMMLDIDHFKQFNDNFGHQAGDAVLKELGEIIMSQCRCGTIDVCCRYGGEEFTIIMPELELHNAVKVAERLRRVVEINSFSINGNNPDAKVTISVGVASIMAQEDFSGEELIKHADDALYLSKRSGRNRVSYTPGEGEGKPVSS